MKIIIGNVFFGLLALGWYRVFSQNDFVFLAGILLAFLAFSCGSCVGYFLHPPSVSLRVQSPAKAIRHF